MCFSPQGTSVIRFFPGDNSSSKKMLINIYVQLRHCRNDKGLVDRRVFCLGTQVDQREMDPQSGPSRVLATTSTVEHIVSLFERQCRVG